MEVIHELLGYERIKIIQNDEMFRFSVDSMLLANFINIGNKVMNIIDLGCGNGPIPLFLTMKTKAFIKGVEVQKEVADLAIKSVKLNGFEDQIEIINDNLKGISKKGYNQFFDIVISNPPYFKYQENSNVNKNSFLTIARHEVEATLNDIVNEAKCLLNDGGSFYMVHRVSRFAEVLNCFESHHFGIKKVQFVYPKTTDDSALMFLVEAKKNRKTDMKVIQPLYICNELGEYTEYVKKIFNFKENDI